MVGIVPDSLSECLAEIGAFAEALTQAEEALQIARTIEHPWAEAFTHRSLGLIYLRQGDLQCRPSLGASVAAQPGRKLPLCFRPCSRALKVCLRPVGACLQKP